MGFDAPRTDRFYLLICRALLAVSRKAFRLRMGLLEHMVKQHSCWAGGFGPDGVCSQPCDRCDPLYILEQERVRGAAF